MLDLTNLNLAQKKAVTHKDGPLLIVAGAGTGKTTVVTSRVAWLIEKGLAKPDEILCLTFTDKAAGEMEERIDKLLPYGYVDLWVMTFHAFCERILHQHGIEIGLPADFKVLDATAQWMMVHQNLDGFHLDHYRPLGSPTKFISAMLTHFSRAKDEGVLPEEYLDYVDDLKLDSDSADFMEFGRKIKSKKGDDMEELWTQEIARRKELANAYHQYQKLVLENGALDFGDLIVYAKKLFNERPAILEEYRKKFKYILVDEFQDTNWAQYDLIKLLAQPANNITVVGDDDQSIYKFRGASLSNILGFKKDFKAAEQVVLSINYRSTQNILDLSYKFIQNNNPHRLEFQLSNDENLKQEAEDKNIDLSSFKAINKQLKAHNDGAGLIDHLHFQTLNQEAAGVVKKIIELRKTDSKSTWADFAILVRANRSAESFLQQLTLAEIPYQFLASQGLYSRPAILDLVSYFKLLDSYAESTALYRILILPTVDLTNEDLMLLLHHAKKKSLSLMASIKAASQVGVSEEGIKKCSKVVDLVEKHSYEARTRRVSEIAMAFIDDFGLKSYFENLDPLKQKETYSLLNHFWKVMQQFEAEQDDKTTKAFLQFLEIAREAGDAGALPQDFEEGPDTVKIMTVHGSKGLEFKYVFLVNLVDRRFPTSERKDPIPLPEALIKEISQGEDFHLEEERRLCYVALTRAKFGLFLTSAQDYGGSRAKKLSRFLSEMGFEKKEPQSLTGTVQWGQGLSQSFEAVRSKEFDYKQYLPKTFSYTQLKVFQTCPWQYRYAFIMKIPVQGRHTFSFGKTMHSTLQKFFNQLKERNGTKQGDLFGGGSKDGQAPTLEEMFAMYEDSWIDDWYLGSTHKEEYYQKGKTILKEFYKLHKKDWPQTDATEKGFTLKIGPYSLRGSIDRIDRVGKKLKLVDYKTGSVPKRDGNLDKDQLLIYQIAAEDVLGEEVEELTYYYLNEQVAKSFLGSQEDKDKLKEKVITVLNELTNSNFEPKPSEYVCKNCDFKDICSYSMA